MDGNPDWFFSEGTFITLIWPTRVLLIVFRAVPARVKLAPDNIGRGVAFVLWMKMLLLESNWTGLAGTTTNGPNCPVWTWLGIDDDWVARYANGWWWGVGAGCGWFAAREVTLLITSPLPLFLTSSWFKVALIAWPLPPVELPAASWLGMMLMTSPKGEGFVTSLEMGAMLITGAVDGCFSRESMVFTEGSHCVDRQYVTQLLIPRRSHCSHIEWIIIDL